MRRSEGRRWGVLRPQRSVVGAVDGNSFGNSYGDGYDYSSFGKNYDCGYRNGNGNRISKGNGDSAVAAGTRMGTALNLVPSSDSLRGAFDTHVRHGLLWVDNDDRRELEEVEAEEEGGPGSVANRRAFDRQGGGARRMGGGSGGGGGARALASVNDGEGGVVGKEGEEISTMSPMNGELGGVVRGGAEGGGEGGGGGGVDRWGFIKAVVGGLMAGPVIGNAFQGGGIPAAEAVSGFLLRSDLAFSLGLVCGWSVCWISDAIDRRIGADE